MTFLQTSRGDKRTRSSIILKIGDSELYLYGEILIGLRSPDGTYRLNWNSYTDHYTAREKKSIKDRQDAWGFNASWIAPKSNGELRELAYKEWMRQFGIYARARMTGDV